MKPIFKLALALIFFTAGVSSAEPPSEGSLILSIAGVAQESMDEVSASNKDNTANFGGGVLIEIEPSDSFGIETGVISIEREYEINQYGARLVNTVDQIRVPVLARYWPEDWVSLGVGPYFGFNTGSVKKAYNYAHAAIVNNSSTADAEIEYGLEGALTLNFAVNDKTGIFLEGRYSYLLEQEANETTNDLSALAGLKIDL